jgi:hypothetical protein
MSYRTGIRQLNRLREALARDLGPSPGAEKGHQTIKAPSVSSAHSIQNCLRITPASDSLRQPMTVQVRDIRGIAATLGQLIE